METEAVSAVASAVLGRVYLETDGRSEASDPRRTELAAWILDDGKKPYHVEPYGRRGWLPCVRVGSAGSGGRRGGARGRVPAGLRTAPPFVPRAG